MVCPNCGRKESGRPGQVEVSERCPNNCYNGRVLCSRCAGNGFYQDRHGDLVDCGKCSGGYMTDETCGDPAMSLVLRRALPLAISRTEVTHP
jgi:ribosomal protein S27AE